MIVNVMFVRFCALVSLGLWNVGFAGADPDDEKPAEFVIEVGDFKRTYLCADGVEAGAIDDGVIHANLKRGENRYLLITYSYMSRPGNPNGRCGAGIESFLVWLHIRKVTVVANQSVQYGSCWKDIYGYVLGWSGRSFEVEYEDFDYDPETKKSKVIGSEARFDMAAPEKGIQVVSKEVDS